MESWVWRAPMPVPEPGHTHRNRHGIRCTACHDDGMPVSVRHALCPRYWVLLPEDQPMFTVKRLTGILSAVLVLFLVPGVSAMAQEAPSQEPAVEAQVRPGQGAVRAVQFSPDGARLAVGGGANIRLYDAHTQEVVSLLTGHTREVYSVAFSPDAQTLASGSDDHTVRLWDITTGTLHRTLEGHTGQVYSVAFSRNGRILASGSGDHTVRLWDVATGTLRHTLESHTDQVYSVAFSPDGRILASGSGDHTVRLWDVATGT
ncbi:MAG: WD40 repeat domain-containing protein, partial [Caldilineaceae bacterium SB0662_bin_9]|nr:WD40 repeat domain-containing protein [Caldilineaceae bacterium SB0662_bin_9]